MSLTLVLLSDTVPYEIKKSNGSAGRIILLLLILVALSMFFHIITQEPVERTLPSVNPKVKSRRPKISQGEKSVKSITYVRYPLR